MRYFKDKAEGYIYRLTDENNWQWYDDSSNTWFALMHVLGQEVLKHEGYEITEQEAFVEIL